MKQVYGMRQQQGFLMIEVSVAIVIISVALFAIAGMFIQSTMAGKQAADYTVATNLAQQAMEYLKNGQTPPYTTTTLNGVTYDIQWSPASPPPTAGQSGYIPATVIVTARGLRASVEVNTLLLQGDITAFQYPRQ